MGRWARVTVTDPPQVTGLGMNTFRWEYVKDSSDSRATSSNNHQSSIILHQFQRDYSIWGQVGAEDVDHPNPYLFTGRRFDTETGLYYYRARYYHPEIGRFLQTDPIGYGDGMNWYAYCQNSPLARIDPFGLANVLFYDGPDPAGFDSIATHPDYDHVIDLRVPNPIMKLWTEGEGGMSEGEAQIEWIRRKILKLRRDGVDITEIYFADHGWDGRCRDGLDLWQCDEGGLELGDQLFTPRDYDVNEYSLKDFAEMLTGVTDAATTIHLRSCYGGLIADRIAEWSNRTTTGFTGPLYPTNQGILSPEGPYYWPRQFPQQYRVYGPGGELIEEMEAEEYFEKYKR